MDSSGSVVPNASVTVVDTATGRTFNVKSSERGTYTVPALAPSKYTVTADAPGFDSVLHSNVEVTAFATVTVDVKLKVGAANQTVTVLDLPPQLDTVNGTLEVAIPHAIYESLPVAMAGGPMSPLGFVTLAPGVSAGGNNTIVLNGGAGEASGTYINGLPVVNLGLGGDRRPINWGTSLDAVKEFQVLTSGIPAYYTGAGVINLVMKSGTDQFHGDAYWVVRNTAFDAAGYFATTTPIEHQNEFGATIGGPILKDKLFFLFNFDGYHFVQTTPPVNYDLPSLAERQGDFSGLLPGVSIYDPNTVKCTPTPTGGQKCTATKFQGNIIPHSRLSPISLFLQSFLPNPVTGLTVGNYFGSLTTNHTQDTYYGKLDYALSKSNNLSFLAENGYLSDAALPVTGGGTQLPIPYTSARYAPSVARLYGIQDTHTFTSNLLNIFGYQINRIVAKFRSPTNSGAYGAKAAGLTGIPAGDASIEFPPITFAGIDAPTRWAVHPQTSNANSFSTSQVFQDNVQWVHNNHNLTVGGEVRFNADNGDGTTRNQLNNITFSSHETAGFNAGGALVTTQGSAYASFLLGAVDNAGLTDSSVTEVGSRFRRYAAYAQDDWRISRRLTLNLGVRYDLPLPLFDVHNRTSYLNPTLPNSAVDNYPGALEFTGYGAGTCNCRNPVKAHYLNVEPRVGFAFVPTNNVVLRGSYGIVHFLSSGLTQNGGQLGYIETASFTTPDNGIHQAFNWASGFPAYPHPPLIDPTLNTGFNTTTPQGGGVTYLATDRAGRAPYTEYWNLTIQQQLTSSTAISISYAGSASHLLPLANGFGPYSNFLDPRYLAIGKTSPTLLTAPVTPATLAQAQAIYPGITLPYANFQGTLSQMLRPFPQYSGVTEVGANAADGHYHALQVLLQNQLNHGLFVHAAYTWNREIDNAGGGHALQGDATPSRTPYDIQMQRSVSDSPEQVFSGAAVYTLPFGHGHQFGGSNPIVDGLFGGWKVSLIATYSEGAFLGPFTTGACNLPNAGTCYADYNPSFAGPARINGSWNAGSGQGLPKSPKTAIPHIDKNAFQNPLPFTYGTTPVNGAYALRGPASENEDVAFEKNFTTWRETNLRLKASAFNVFNRTVFGGIVTNLSVGNFGDVTTQANSPRILQFETKLSF